MIAPGELRLTPMGWKAILLYGAIVISFYAIPYNNLLFMMVAFLTCLGILAAIWTLRNVHGLTSEVVSIGPAPAHASHEVRFRIDPARRPRFRTSLALKVAGAWHTVGTLGVVAGPEAGTGRLEGLPRGLHRVESVAVQSSYPFGFLLGRRSIDARLEVISYPRPADLSRNPDAQVSQLLGDLLSPSSRGSPAGLREYCPGDPLRSIHWKASARRLEFVVKELDADCGQRIEIVLDRRCTDRTFETALSTLSAIAQRAHDTDRQITLRTQGLTATYGPDQRPFRSFLAWMAEARPLETVATAPPAAPPTALRLPSTRAKGRTGRA